MEDYDYSEDEDAKDKILLLQAQIESMQEMQKKKKAKFNGVEVPRRNGIPPRRNAPVPTKPVVPTILGRGQPVPASMKMNPPTSREQPANPGKTSNHDETSYKPPHTGGKVTWKPVGTSWVNCGLWIIFPPMYPPITFWVHLDCDLNMCPACNHQ